jgi:hypothetical protein
MRGARFIRAGFSSANGIGREAALPSVMILLVRSIDMGVGQRLHIRIV